MEIQFTTETVHPRDRVAYWQDTATKAYVRHVFKTSLGSDFRGELRAGSLGRLAVSTYEVDRCGYERRRDDLPGSDDDLLLHLLLAGTAILHQDDRVATIRAGDMALLDTRRPFRGAIPDGVRSVVVKIPRQSLESRLGNVSELSARVIKAHDPVGGLAAGFIAMLPSRLDAMEGVVGLKVAEQVIDLVATALVQAFGKRLTALSSPRALALLRLKSAIEARLSDPDLRPATAAATAGISVRYANELLLAEDMSLERYILWRRLERCRGALEDPAQHHRTVGEIAFSWGFSDLSHFGRRFKAAFGSTPNELRRQAQAGENGAAARAPISS